MLIALTGDITFVAFLTNFGALFIFMTINMCLIKLRYSHDHIPRRFMVPLNIGRFPVIPAIGLLSCTLLLFSFDKKMFLGGILLFLSGLLFYKLFGEKEQRRTEKLFAEIAVDHNKSKRNIREKKKKPNKAHKKLHDKKKKSQKVVSKKK